jgi:hypothetical protein
MNAVVIFLLISVSGLFAVHSDIDIAKIFASYFYYILYIQEPDTNGDDESVDMPVVVVPYEKKYLDQFECMEDVEVSKEKMDSLENCYIIEYTPVGNVAMAYSSKREAFVYFADHIVPYRYLETIARRYAITYMCRGLVATTKMNHLLKKKTVGDDISDKEMEMDRLGGDTVVESVTTPATEDDSVVSDVKDDTKVAVKSVFAKFKTYNKVSMMSNTSGERGDKNIRYNDDASVSNDTETKHDTEDRKSGDEDNTNRYSCEGRFSNFIMTKKPEMSLFNTRLKMSFADFKKQKNSV